ncbi:MAG TPA: P1 family peptidase [Rectinemataceae bacterium]|nr:P1 family peptidase [Rectinemataceae bacterium]
MQKRLRDYGIEIGEMRRGKLNKISDVRGVLVGHCTIDADANKTGVTFISPSTANPFSRKLPAAAFVLNGFGKSLGLLQIEELGSIETPIFLTNTLNVGLVHDAAVGYMIDRCEKDAVELRSVNPIVMECNDSNLNDIKHRVVRAEHVEQAVADIREDFPEGDVGAGKGMICHGLKGGIGSASRMFSLGGAEFTLGVVALTNHGRLGDLTVAGQPLGREILKKREAIDNEDKGSVILVFATDAPLTSRQLKRVIKRGSVGLARLGSFIGHGSGEVFVGFSTAYSVSSENDIVEISMVREERLELLFRAAAECAEEAVLNSMVCASSITGFKGFRCESLAGYMDLLRRP